MNATPITTATFYGIWFVTAEKRVRPGKTKAIQYHCHCKCGTQRWVNAADLAHGRSTNCGCVRREKVGRRNYKHGRTESREYVVWLGIIARCSNPNHKAWGKYGGRGITICAQWRNSFTAFIDDMGPPPSAKHQVDRIDNDGPYEPGNCRWVTNKVNCRNRPGVTMFTIDGITKPLNEWAEVCGLKPKTVSQRIRRGVDTLTALGLSLTQQLIHSA